MELSRMNSVVCPTPPENILLKLVKLNSVESIRTVVKKNPSILNHEYDHPHFKTILQIACSDDFIKGIKTETVDALLELGADRYAGTDVNKTPAWQYAIASGRADIAKSVLRGFNSNEINTRCNGSTALHKAIRECRNANDALNCIEQLVEYGIDVNKTDNKNTTAILVAAEKGHKEIVQYLIDRHYGQIDLDTHVNRKKQTARSIIVNNKLYNGELPKPYMAPMRSAKEQLEDFLKRNQEEEFVRCLGEAVEDLEALCNGNNGNETFLQYACEHNLQLIARCLLEQLADPNLVLATNKEAPVTIATRRGHYEICELLLSHPKTQIPEDLVSVTILNLPRAKDKLVSHRRYIDLLFERVEKLNADVCNHPDWKRSTPLHYACRYGNQDLILELLNRGASLAARNDFDQLAVADISGPTLRKHLDRCMDVPKDESALEPYVTVTYNYQSLIPPARQSVAATVAGTAIDVDRKENLEAFIPERPTTGQEFAPELDVVLYMAESRELKSLLKHPVISSFLYMKWYRIQPFFYANLAFYLAFCLSLVFYLLFFYSTNQDQTVLKCIVTVLFVLLAVRELFQFVVAPKLYLMNVENWLEVSLIVVTSFILCLESPTDNTCKQFSAVGILLAALELILLIGQHPVMAESITMLRTVSKNFFKFLLWYSILIIAFAFSFYTLFKQTPAEANANKDADSSAEKETDFFVDPFMSVFKTIVMLTGEFDAGSLNFVTYPLTSRVIFIMFVFMIAIVLFNLLNGLAVSDTQTIRNDAQLVAQIARASHIGYYENILLGSILPRKIMNAIKRCICSCVNDANAVAPVRINCLAGRICLFPKFLPQRRLTVRLSNNECHVIDPTHEKKNRIGSVKDREAKYWNISLDRFTAQETQLWIQEKNAEADSNDATIRKIFTVLEDQQKTIDGLKLTLENFVNNQSNV